MSASERADEVLALLGLAPEDEVEAEEAEQRPIRGPRRTVAGLRRARQLEDAERQAGAAEQDLRRQHPLGRPAARRPGRQEALVERGDPPLRGVLADPATDAFEQRLDRPRPDPVLQCRGAQVVGGGVDAAEVEGGVGVASARERPPQGQQPADDGGSTKCE